MKMATSKEKCTKLSIFVSLLIGGVCLSVGLFIVGGPTLAELGFLFAQLIDIYKTV